MEIKTVNNIELVNQDGETVINIPTDGIESVNVNYVNTSETPKFTLEELEMLHKMVVDKLVELSAEVGAGTAQADTYRAYSALCGDIEEAIKELS